MFNIIKKYLLLFMLCIPVLATANMANPWVDGSSTSTLYGSKNADVLAENIDVKILKSTPHELYAQYNIIYIIESLVEQNLPLLFIGDDLQAQGSVNVNDHNVELLDYKMSAVEETAVEREYSRKGTNVTSPISAIQFTQEETQYAQSEDLMYFHAPITKGTNTIHIRYDANLGYDKTGFVRTHALKYALYPSKFWRSFGTINLKVEVPNDIQLIDANIGDALIENNFLQWEITNVQERDTQNNHLKVEDIEIRFEKKLSHFHTLLLAIHPIGFSIIALLIGFIVHLKLLIRCYKAQEHRHKKKLLYGYTIMMPIFIHIFFIISTGVIELIINQDNTATSPYIVILFMFTIPMLIVMYALAVVIIVKLIKVSIHEEEDNTQRRW